MTPLVRGCVAEAIGTFALVFFGAGAILMTSDATGGAGSLVTVALAHGIALSVFITGTMYISGGQLNPAVSIGLFSIGKQSAGQTAAFVASQLFAAACAAGMLVWTIGPDVANNAELGTNVGATIGSMTVAGDVRGVLVLEFLQAFALMTAVLTTAVDPRTHKVGGFGIGLTVAMCIMAFGPMTGSSMNPARTFGPALYGHWDMHWAYWLGPVAGAVAASMVYKFVWGASEARPAA